MREAIGRQRKDWRFLLVATIEDDEDDEDDDLNILPPRYRSQAAPMSPSPVPGQLQLST